MNIKEFKNAINQRDNNMKVIVTVKGKEYDLYKYALSWYFRGNVFHLEIYGKVIL